jgi:hypothetical protein
MKRIIYLILIASLCASCHKQEAFTKTYEITGEIFISGDSLLDPWGISVQDSILLLCNKKGLPPIEAYSIKDQSAICKFGVIGDGPKEILGTGGMQRSPNEKAFLVYDMFKKKFLEYPIPDIIKGIGTPSNIYSFKQTSYANQKDTTTVLFNHLLMGKRNYIGESLDTRGRIVLFDKGGHVLCFGGNYPPNTYENLSDYEYANLYSGKSAMNSEETKVAMVTHSADMLDIFSIANDSVYSIWSHQGALPDHIYLYQSGDYTGAAFTGESMVGYQDVSVSGKYIYALYSGKKTKEKDSFAGNIIRVVSWDGKRTFEIHTTDYQLQRLSVSNDDKMIYAISEDHEKNPVIVAYNIANLVQ